MRTPAEVERSNGGARADEGRGLERELGELRKEVLESRNLIIKTDNLLKNLHAELKVVSKRHEDQYRRTWFSSAAAYGAFIALAAVAGLMGARAAVSSERAQIEIVRSEAEQARKRADEQASQLAKLKGEQGQLKSEGEKALTIYQGMNEGDGESRLRGVEAMTQLDRARLSGLEQLALDDKAGNLKKELARTAFERGKTSFRKNDMKAAITDLRRFLALDPAEAEAVQAAWFLGAALYQNKDYDGAVEQLEKFAANSKGQKNADYALMLLGQSYIQTGKNDKAMEILRRALGEFPASQYVPQMQLQFKVAWRGANGGTPTATPGPAAPAAAAAGTGTSGPAPAPAPAAATPQH